ncbi:MAG TPA: MBOAT family O-acyltransferase [Leptospiraceae bacterium]|nr:hypothetical protein [Leptospirales bacterium]HMX55940.1 MBOAT family O-acyltransferase [Leptospiraceae bacterium]HMY46060.1 MBOAT family O-acyltransferase [Leptospiraceae bacterium]HMZ36156.1 MBOAT family O-acyltransferase [Leptospiraceae bacterium]HNE24206.1 MBOAT family O-acyltransferase [Leptospiraceae bacterium]
MLFVTAQFLVFLVCTVVIYWVLPPKFRIWFLTAASLFFYATWNPRFMLHFLVVVGVNWSVIELWRVYRKNWIFYVLQLANLCNLAFFKYFYFFADIIGRSAGISWLEQPAFQDSQKALGYEILLPLAISFYTFQIMSYGFDIFRGVYTEKNSLLELLLFKAFFPQLIAGPIMRSAELLPQIRQCRTEGLTLDQNSFYKGLWLCMIGVVKKVLIADRLMEYLGPIIGTKDPSVYAPLYLWLAVIAFAAMVYSDFSAYSDLARGFGLLLGFQIPVNFKAPLFFISVTDFWRRWHITFSRWLRDYIYIALGGNRVSKARLYFNFIFTFFIGGLWHGAAYTYVVWGILLGVMLSIESFMESKGIPEFPVTWWGRILRRLLGHLMFWPTTVFFMGTSWTWCMHALSSMANLPRLVVADGLEPMHVETALYAMAGVLVFHLFDEYPERFAKLRRAERILVPAGGLALILILSQFTGGQKDFFYFQF